MKHATASILSVGDELILGQSLDRHAQWLADRLTSLGVRTLEHVTVDDDHARMVSAIRRLADQSDLLLITGGLGPTADDLTREALAEVLAEDLVEDAPALADLLAWFEGRGKPMPGRNRVQALRPASARCLDNPNGTAPGLAATISAGERSCDLFALPGPPREMHPMFERFVAPAIRPTRDVRTRVLRTFGLGESAVAELLGELMDRDRNPLIGTTASQGIVSIRIRWEGPLDVPSPTALLDADEHAVRDRLGPIVLGLEPDLGKAPLVAAISSLLRERNQTLATVESCTAGGIGQAITGLPGSSDVYLGGFVTYTNRLKAQLVGVPEELLRAHGAVSPEVARAMALGGLARTAADHCLALTGIAGPDGGSDDKPVGTVWIALASENSTVADVRRFVFKGGREAVREWSVNAALGMLRARLIDADAPLLGEVERVQ